MAKFFGEILPALLTLAVGVGALAVCLIYSDQYALPKARTVGLVLVYGGMAVLIWAAVHLKGAIGGLVAPRLDYVVTTGPFRFTRHPVYLGATIAMIGISIVAESAYGLLAILLVFVPVELVRAKKEEEALIAQFGEAYREYAARVNFFLPFIPRRRRR